MGKDDPHNLVITAGGGYSLLHSVQKVALYDVDLKAGKHTKDPIVEISSITDPLYLLIPYGTYDIVVYVRWVSGPILLGRVVIAENELVVFGTRTIDLPKELIVR